MVNAKVEQMRHALFILINIIRGSSKEHGKANGQKLRSKNVHNNRWKKVKLPAHRAGLPGKEPIVTLHPLYPPTRRGLRDVLPVSPVQVSPMGEEI